MFVRTLVLFILCGCQLTNVKASCTASSCQNGATCIPKNDGFQCACAPGYIGERCRINAFDCLGNPCAPGGVCHDLVNDFRCECHEGFTGKTCETRIDNNNPCQSMPCQNGGTCSRAGRQGEYICSCPRGLTGKHCSLSSSLGQPATTNKAGIITLENGESGIIPCDNGGEYVRDLTRTGDEYSCQCSPWYSGVRCAQLSAMAMTLLIILVLVVGASLAGIIVVLMRRRAKRSSLIEVQSAPTAQSCVSCISGNYLTLQNTCEENPAARQQGVRFSLNQPNVYGCEPNAHDSQVHYDEAEPIYQSIDDTDVDKCCQKPRESCEVLYEKPDEDYLHPARKGFDQSEEDYLVPSEESGKQMFASSTGKRKPEVGFYSQLPYSASYTPETDQQSTTRGQNSVVNDPKPKYANQSMVDEENYDDTMSRAVHPSNEYESAADYCYPSLT